MIFSLLLGLLLIVLVFYDVYHGIVLPRQAVRRFRIAPVLVGRLAWIPYRNFGLKIKDPCMRDEYMGHYGVLVFFLLVATWLLLLITGFACVFWALRDQLNPVLTDFTQAFYFAGTSILTIGFGDVLPLTPAARMAALAAGTAGLTLFGLCLSCVFNLQTLLFQREVLLAVLFSRLEGKFSGLNLLLQHSKFGTVEYLRSDIRDWEKWLATVNESHRDFPLLAFFRSTGKGESWVTCLGSMLDMCNILNSCATEYDYGECLFFHRLGSSSAQLFCFYLALPVTAGGLITEAEFALGYDQLKQAGFVLKDQDSAWKAFSERRCEYAPYIMALCKYYAANEPVWLLQNPSGISL